MFDGVPLNGADQQFTGQGVAAGASTAFEVRGYNTPGRDYVDDRSVVAVRRAS